MRKLCIATSSMLSVYVNTRKMKYGDGDAKNRVEIMTPYKST